jgi:hypothetical protein
MDSMNPILFIELDTPRPESLYRSFCQPVATAFWIRHGKTKKQLLLAQAMLKRATSSL